MWYSGNIFETPMSAPAAKRFATALFGHPVIETVELVPGKLVKEIVVAGHGETPMTGHNVKAHYTGKLTNGEVRLVSRVVCAPQEPHTCPLALAYCPS